MGDEQKISLHIASFYATTMMVAVAAVTRLIAAARLIVVERSIKDDDTGLYVGLYVAVVTSASSTSVLFELVSLLDLLKILPTRSVTISFAAPAAPPLMSSQQSIDSCDPSSNALQASD